tara:strand:+ start:4746 stop:5261 length:516 start_codon:yes stop_codon:yes gene_type:complete
MAAPVPPMSEMSSEEQAVLSRAEDADMARDQAFQEMSPVGSFSLESLNILVDSLNNVLPIFEVDEPYPTFEAEIEDGPLPAEFVAAIEMIRAAAMDAGLERLAPDLSEASDDTALEDAAAKIDTLAENQTFRTFLRTAISDMEEPMAEEEVAVEEAEVSDEEADALFAERL